MARFISRYIVNQHITSPKTAPTLNHINFPTGPGPHRASCKKFSVKFSTRAYIILLRARAR
nr:MAG TPA: hypothetical protein [Caudoviricetes sp.]